MKLEDVKIGEKYRVLDRDKCGSYSSNGGEHTVIIDKTSSGNLEYNIYDKEGTKVNYCCSCFGAEDLLPYEKTLENLEVGDILTCGSAKKMVLGVCGKVYCVSEYDDYEASDNWYTVQEIEQNGWKLYTEPKAPTVQELTVEQISEKLGYEVKVVKNK